MITVKQSRDKDGEHFELDTLTFNDSLEAVAHLAKVELGWGGQIVEINESRIKVQTSVLHCLDTSVFEGPAEEMKPLFELAYFYLGAREKYGDLIVDQTVEHTQQLPNGIGGVPPEGGRDARLRCAGRERHQGRAQRQYRGPGHRGADIEGRPVLVPRGARPLVPQQD